MTPDSDFKPGTQGLLLCCIPPLSEAEPRPAENRANPWNKTHTGNTASKFLYYLLLSNSPALWNYNTHFKGWDFFHLMVKHQHDHAQHWVSCKKNALSLVFLWSTPPLLNKVWIIPLLASGQAALLISPIWHIPCFIVVQYQEVLILYCILKAAWCTLTTLGFIWHSRAQGIYHMQSMKPFRSPNPACGGRDCSCWLFAGLFNQDSRPL